MNATERRERETRWAQALGGAKGLILSLWVVSCGSSPHAPDGPEASSVTVSISGPTQVRQGDVTWYTASVSDGSTTASWSVSPPGAGTAVSDGRFVGYRPGNVRLIATAAGAADTHTISVSARNLSGSLTVVGQGQVPRFTSDLWVHGGYAYTGTIGQRWVDGNRLFGDRLYAWDVRNPAAPVLTDSVIVDALTVNDVKVRADGSLAVLTHEGSADGRNGVTLVSLADPAHPTVITRFSAGLERGVHNTWVEENYLYAVVDDTLPTAGVKIIDISNPASPTAVASFHGGGSFAHDLYVRNGLAFVSHWNAGLFVLDVGNGIAGGTPSSPVQVSRITVGTNTHNAWYWPEGGYIFVGDELFSSASPGGMHVVDARNLRQLSVVATLNLPVDPPHNFWMDEQREILYLAWYRSGLAALDVSGELLGDLRAQGRVITAIQYAGALGCPAATTCTRTWAPQLVDSLIFVSDINTGLWVLRPTIP